MTTEVFARQLEQSADRKTRWILNGLLAAGIVVRLLVLLTAGAENADNHLEVIRYIALSGHFPVSNLLGQSYHPPLYYAMMAPIYSWWQDRPPLHFIAFLFSSANLLLLRKLVADAIVGARGRTAGFALLCFMPQVVMFGSYISNDTLAMLVGTMLFLTAIRYIRQASMGRLCVLGAMLGTGLLSKGSFLLMAPVLTILVALVERRRKLAARVAVLMLFCAVWVTVGCYKYVDNYIRLGNPLVNNLDANPLFLLEQSGTWKGASSLYDVNVLKLIRRPVLQTHNTFSYPLLLYGTLWYPHIPESTFRGNTLGYQWVGSVIYACALFPTAMFLVGAAAACGAGWRALCKSNGQEDAAANLIRAVALGLVAGNLAIVLAAGIRYDVWSCFQSRLCFPTLGPAVVLFGLGISRLGNSRLGNTRLTTVVQLMCWATAAGGLLYFAVEIGLVMGWLAPGAALAP